MSVRLVECDEARRETTATSRAGCRHIHYRKPPLIFFLLRVGSKCNEKKTVNTHAHARVHAHARAHTRLGHYRATFVILRC